MQASFAMKILPFIVVGVAIYLFVYGGTGRVGGPMSPPIGVTYRDSYVGAGIVMDIANHSDKTLYGVRVHIVGGDGRSTDAKVAAALKSGEDKEVGWMQLDGWKLENGEEVSVYADGYPTPFCTKCLGHRN